MPRLPRKRAQRKATWRSGSRAPDEVLAVAKRLGQRIRALRLEQNVTIGRAAAAAGLSYQHWPDLESGRSNPTLSTLIGVARALQVPLRLLFAKEVVVFEELPEDADD